MGAGELLEIKEICDRFVQTSRHSLELWERGGISSAFDQAEKVNGHTEDFSKVFLAFAHLAANLPNALSELFSQ